MSPLELIIICIFCFIQSLFGVGLLILGVPTFILFGYEYFEVLNIILPYSILISFLQIITAKKQDFDFGIKIIKFSFPTVILGLIFINYIYDTYILIIFISLILIIFSTANLFNNYLKYFKIKNLKLSLVILGLIHGISNLGGPLLTIITAKEYKIKDKIRYNIAIGYFLFSLFQILIINILYLDINFYYLKFIWVPILIYFISEKIFIKINNKLFYKLINTFILCYGLFIFLHFLFKSQILSI